MLNCYIVKLLKGRESGFTFIELILVVSLVLILGTMGTSLTARFMTQNAVANAQDQLIGDLRKAQMNAMAGKQGCATSACNWGVNYSSNIITLYKGSNFGARDQAFDEEFSVPGGVSITSSTGILDWNFTRVTGMANNTPATITISGNGTIKQVTVNGQGMVTR